MGVGGGEGAMVAVKVEGRWKEGRQASTRRYAQPDTHGRPTAITYVAGINYVESRQATWHGAQPVTDTRYSRKKKVAVVGSR